MIKYRFYKLILLLPLIISIFLFFQIEKNDARLIQSSLEDEISYKYSNDIIKVSNLPIIEMNNDLQEYKLTVNTCIKKSNSNNCLALESEKIFNNLSNCEIEARNILEDSYDLINKGLTIKYYCSNLIEDVFASLKNKTNKIN